MRFIEILTEMSRAEAKAVWLRNGVDPDKVPNLGKARGQLAMKLHPDRGGDEEELKLVNAAYDVLKKPESQSASAGNGDSDFSDFKQPRQRERNWYYDPNANSRRENEKEESDAKWAWAGHSGGMRPSSTIYKHDYTDVNYIKKRMWELSGHSKEEWTIWGFDGAYLRNVTTVYGSSKIFSEMAKAMVVWQTQGGNPYKCRAVVVERREPYRSKPFNDPDDDQENAVLLIWADGVFYDKDPIPVEYETFNKNPGNDSTFSKRLRKLIDDLKEHGGRMHDQPDMGMSGGGSTTAHSHTRIDDAPGHSEFDIGSYVVHPKFGVGRVINPNAKKGMARVTFKIGKTGNVKLASLRKATPQEQWQFDYGEEAK